MNALLFLQIVAPLVPQIVRLTEQLMPGPKRGQRKRRRAVKTIEALAKSVPELAEELVKIADGAGKQVDQAVERMNMGEPPLSAPPPQPVDLTPPANPQ